VITIITNELAKQLISALKNLTYKSKIIEFPSIGEQLKLQAQSIDMRFNFNFVINRCIIRPDKPELKVTFLVLYENTSLTRIDIAGQEHVILISYKTVTLKTKVV